MKKIQAHILKIKKWNQKLDKIKGEKIMIFNYLTVFNELSSKILGWVLQQW